MNQYMTSAPERLRDAALKAMPEKADVLSRVEFEGGNTQAWRTLIHVLGLGEADLASRLAPHLGV
jgi:hypothetical protein